MHRLTEMIVIPTLSEAKGGICCWPMLKQSRFLARARTGPEFGMTTAEIWVFRALFKPCRSPPLATRL